MTGKSTSFGRLQNAIACVVILAGGALAGCAANGAGSAMTSTGSIAGAMDCRTMQADLDRLYRGGIAAKTEAVNAGKILPAKDRSDVRQYNALLIRYVEKKCHK